MPDDTQQQLLSWFQANGGQFDVESLGFTNFPDSEGGRGVMALKDIPEEHVLFSIPRSLLLSTQTSHLPSRFGPTAWKDMQLNQGWTGLILCMMWESANSGSKWKEYLAILPNHFDTPMFWDENDLKELDGTSVVEKLGREEAEQAYREKVLPAIQSRPDLFPPESAHFYTLANYHLMGSRILSRSFSVERWDSGEEEAGASSALTNTRSHEMDVDSPDGPEGEHGDNESEVEEEDDEDSSDTAMVPMADMLNARYGSENAKLFDDENDLRMVSTKPIKAGEQIWNTYGDLPNAELIRRYGHIDLLPLPNEGVGNPGDVAEIRADIAVSVILQKDASLSEDSLRERIDWWLEEGGDDVFVLEADLELPPLLISLIHLLILDRGEWESAKSKGKPPKPKIDAYILGIVHEVLETRLKAYPTTLQEDESTFSKQITRNQKHALVVRMGEKRILHGLLVAVRNLQAKHSEKANNKRKGGGGGDSNPHKRSRH
ncbi:hypothetical protein H0H87_004277 [Tephrocybe sp. NHM501043]|nr:hypothetical protein H0H87_004277 [Tephrocybe sp. NHM501043]